MLNWIANHWWLFWGIGGSGVLVAYRLRQTPGEDPENKKTQSIITRIIDPDGRQAKQIPMMFLLVGVGLLAALIVIGVVNFLDWYAGR
jgi:hypothetical protein